MTEMIVHDDRDTIIAGLREQLRVTREELAAERAKGNTVEEGVRDLRRTLSPLYSAFQKVFGEMEIIQPLQAEPSATPYYVQKTGAAWDSWKQKLSGSAARAIDILMLHGSLNAEQLRIHLGCANRTCYNIIGELNRFKLINKNGGKVSLKEL